MNYQVYSKKASLSEVDVKRAGSIEQGLDE